jgi:SAM-dependent methyltransferase
MDWEESESRRPFGLAWKWHDPAGVEAIYERPQDYDLEHEGDDEDIDFYLGLVRRLRPARVLELASGSGRVTIPLAKLAPSLGYEIVGLEIAETMLAEAERKRAALDADAQSRVRFVRGDIRTWAADVPFDLVITPCSSLSHLLSLDDQLAAWRRAHDNLAAGGRFVADLTMANVAVYAESMQTPPRTTLEIDIDTTDPATGVRMLRYKTTRYLPHEQRAEIRFLYDKFPEGESVDRYVSDFDAHVYYPRELELLFRITGFEVESRYGNYNMKPMRRSSRQMIYIGQRPA